MFSTIIVAIFMPLCVMATNSTCSIPSLINDNTNFNKCVFVDAVEVAWLVWAGVFFYLFLGAYLLWAMYQMFVKKESPIPFKTSASYSQV